MSALHFKTDTKEEAFVLNELQEQALMKTLLENRDPRLYKMLYGEKPVRNVVPLESSWSCLSLTANL